MKIFPIFIFFERWAFWAFWQGYQAKGQSTNRKSESNNRIIEEQPQKPELKLYQANYLSLFIHRTLLVLSVLCLGSWLNGWGQPSLAFPDNTMKCTELNVLRSLKEIPDSEQNSITLIAYSGITGFLGMDKHKKVFIILNSSGL